MKGGPGLAALLLVACGDVAPPAVAGPAERDSAGVALAEHADLDGLPIEVPDPQPLLQIGSAAGAPEDQLFDVVAGTRLADGRVVLLNRGTSEVRVFGADGTFQASQGRTGDGPGEYRRLSRLAVGPGDSLLVWDVGIFRLSMLTPEGTLARSVNFQGVMPGPDFLGVFDDGSWLFASRPLADPAGAAEQQVIGHTFRYFAEGERLDSVGSHPTMRLRLGALPDGRMGTQRIVWDHETVHAVGSDAVWRGTTRDHSVELIGSDGQLHSRVRWPGPDLAATQQDRDRYVEEVVALTTDEAARREVRSYLPTAPYADRFPAYNTLVADADGGVWIQEFRRPGASGPARWLAFDPAGHATRAVELPPRARVLWTGGDEVLLHERDELDVEHVRLHRLVAATKLPNPS